MKIPSDISVMGKDGKVARTVRVIEQIQFGVYRVIDPHTTGENLIVVDQNKVKIVSNGDGSYRLEPIQ
jgi:hypothetical protein